MSKLTNEDLLASFLTECWMYGYSAINPSPIHKEVLRRMACYQYAVKSLNKKLYEKVVINL